MKILSFNTLFGWITLEEHDGNVKSIKFTKKNNIGKSNKLVKLKKQITEYINGKTNKISTNLELKGTILQKKIWHELTKIPYGSTKSYGEIAKKIKTSPRYVGNVCGQNKHLIVIPCHRVIRSDGNLGGFSSRGGIKLKKKLLLLEKNND
tara:strand:- start:181 stop:630 length:450 start_codon:yes stop_codon:yes gene_type:complete